MTASKFDIDTFFEQDANAIFSARANAMAIHKTKNIDAAGDEIELPVKSIIKDRLPSQYYVGQGHIVDENLTTSGQFDLLVGDNKGSPILFSSKNNTDYLTFESVYSFGEIKSSYYKSKNYITAFIKQINVVNQQLIRAKTPKDQLTQDVRFQTSGSITITNSDRRNYKNPLFKFMFFVDSGDLQITDVLKILNSTPNIDCPNLMCFLDKGIFVKAIVRNHISIPNIDISRTNDINYAKEILEVIKNTTTQSLGNIELFPEFISEDQENFYKWTFLEFLEEKKSASILSFLIYSLNIQLNSGLLLKPDLMKYHEKLFKIKKLTTV